MKYFVSCSFGKDSIATVLLALLHNEPLDGAVFAEVMFDNERGISGEVPEHIDWIKNVAKPKLEAMGCPVYIVKNTDTDYVHQFNHIIKSSKYPERIGKKQGFLLGGMCILNSRAKVVPIRRFYKQFNDDITQYIGIAIDEPKRLARMHKDKTKVSLLEKYKYTEEMATELCKAYGLLSPIYSTANRGGCWFCPNAKLTEMASLKKNHPELWNELATLAKQPDYIGGFKYSIPFEDIDKQIDQINTDELESNNT